MTKDQVIDGVFLGGAVLFFYVAVWLGMRVASPHAATTFGRMSISDFHLEHFFEK